ncbi:unnamed protein product, partial [marine sediment metagenome]
MTVQARNQSQNPQRETRTFSVGEFVVETREDR